MEIDEQFEFESGESFDFGSAKTGLTNDSPTTVLLLVNLQFPSLIPYLVSFIYFSLLL